MRQTIFCIVLLVLALASGISLGLRFFEQNGWQQKLSSVEKRLDDLALVSKEKRKSEEIAQKADPSYLQNSVCPLPLLNLERGSLELLQKKQELSDPEKKRFHYLTQENFLSFQSGKKIALGAFHEVEEKLRSTVQVDEYDLAKILDAIENTSQASLRIKRLHLEKHPMLPLYTLYLELWRKE